MSKVFTLRIVQGDEWYEYTDEEGEAFEADTIEGIRAQLSEYLDGEPVPEGLVIAEIEVTYHKV